jgi:peptidoglycan/xylan/chitin deacetylase (PgdA/CDA1 family)
MLASLGYRALRATGLLAVARLLRSDGVILCYHNVVAAGDRGTGNGLGLHMPRTDFERQVRWLAGHYDVVPLEEFVARRARGASLRGVAALTFDDGYAGVFANAWPLLQQLGLPATVFVVAQAPTERAAFWWDHPAMQRGHSAAQRDEWLTVLRGDRDTILRAMACDNGAVTLPPALRPADWETIAQAARAGLGIGAHSTTHRALPALSGAEQQIEIVHARDIVTRQTGIAPQFFAYPYGLWNEQLRDTVRAAGYRAAFTLDHDRSTGAMSAWSLPRVNVPAGITDAAFQAWTAGLEPRRRA